MPPWFHGMTFPPRNSFGERKKAGLQLCALSARESTIFKIFLNVNKSGIPINTGAGSILSAEKVSELLLLTCPQNTSRACIYRYSAFV